MTTLISITGMWVATRRLPVEPHIRLLLNATLGMATLQVSYMGNLKTMKNLFGYIMSAWSFHKQAQDIFFPMNQLWNVPAVNAWNVQVTLGISTLLTYVPASLGAAHQAGALTLFTIVLALMHSLRRPLSTSFATAQLSQQQKSLLKAWK
jgi:cytochrome c oxidase assembly protein subunit 15